MIIENCLGPYYNDLESEMQKMWHLKQIVIKKKSEDHIKRIPGNPCLQELQKIVLNGTAHLLRRVLSM